MMKSKLKVITLTPNPALDLSGHVNGLIPNEKNYVFAEKRDPGGNGINAARIATRLKANVIATGWLGGASGQDVKRLLDLEKVGTAFLPIAGETRTNVTVTNESTHQQTRLTFPGPRISAKEQAALFKALKEIRGEGIFIIGGSLPPGLKKTFHSEVAKVAIQNGFGVIADVPAKNLQALLTSRVSGTSELLLIKPNRSELEEWAGKKLPTRKELIEAGTQLAKKVCLLAISLAEQGALLIYGDQVWMAHAPRVHAKGTVGAGDSMVGAIAAVLLQHGIFLPEHIHELFSVEFAHEVMTLTLSEKRAKKPTQKRPKRQLPFALQDALSWGVAAGAATAEVNGTALAQASEIQRLRKRIKISQIR